MLRLVPLPNAGCVYDRICEQAADPAVIVEPGVMRYLGANDAAVELLGRSREELRRLTVCDVLCPEEAARATSRLNAIDAPNPGRWALRRANGERIYVTNTTLRLRVEGRLVIGSIFRQEAALAAGTETG